MNRRDICKLAGKVGLVALAAQVPWSWLERAGLVGEYLAEAAALPQNYIIESGTILCDTQLGLAGIAGHQVHSGDATWSVSEETGSQWCRPSGVTKVFKAQVTAAGTVTSQYRFDFDISRTLIGVSAFQLPMYYAGSGNAAVLWYVAKEAGFTNYYTYSNGSTPLTPDMWTVQAQARHQPDGTNGVPTISDTFVRVRIRLSMPAGGTGTFYICPMYINWYAKPTVVMTIDDGDETSYTEAFAYMAERNIPGSLGLCQPGIGGSSSPVSTAQVQEMIAAGWSMHNHGATHAHMASMSESELVDEIAGPVNYWGAQGVTLDPHTFLLPFGERSDLVDTVLARSYRYSCLATGATFPLWDGIMNPYKIIRRPLDSPATLPAILGTLNDVEKFGHALIFYGHKLVNGAASGQTEIANFKALIDEITARRDANRIQVRNLADLFTGLTHPRRKRL